MTAALFTEKNLGWCVASILALLSLLVVTPDMYDGEQLLNSFPTIGIGVFGFMLTFIAIILQSDNNTIQHMKSNSQLFNRFVDYNKRVVYTSAVLTISAYIGTALIQGELFSTIPEPQIIIIKMIGFAYFWGILGKMSVDLYMFVKVFYILLKE